MTGLYDTTQSPYRDVVYITATIGGEEIQASGVLIAPDEVLTASHVVWRSDNGGEVATNISVTPGDNGGAFGGFGTARGVALHYHPITDPRGVVAADQAGSDFAVIHLDRRFDGLGVMSFEPDVDSATAHITGYPRALGGFQYNGQQTLSKDPTGGFYAGNDTGAGSDGAPVWVWQTIPNVPGTYPSVIGLVSLADDNSGAGLFTRLTSAAVATIDDWMRADRPMSINLVDAQWYNAEYPDVAAARVDPVAHYAQFGWHEGRYPDAYFATSGYLADNPDVARARVNPAAHYDNFGWREGRDPGPNFNTRLYLLHNPDVAAAGVDPLAHWLNFGQFEGRAISPAIGPAWQIVGGFDREYYLLNNPDVARAGVDPYQHYATRGWLEGRNPDPFFNVIFYLQHNPDVAAAMVEPLRHYDIYGWREGRDPSLGFSTSAYLGHAPDVAAAGIDPLQHYLQNGIFEGRPIS